MASLGKDVAWGRIGFAVTISVLTLAALNVFPHDDVNVYRFGWPRSYTTNGHGELKYDDQQRVIDYGPTIPLVFYTWESVRWPTFAFNMVVALLIVIGVGVFSAIHPDSFAFRIRTILAIIASIAIWLAAFEAEGADEGFWRHVEFPFSLLAILLTAIAICGYLDLACRRFNLR